jgi:hypothetical protein
MLSLAFVVVLSVLLIHPRNSVFSLRGEEKASLNRSGISVNREERKANLAERGPGPSPG